MVLAGWPVVSKASDRMAADTPEPQLVMTGRFGSMPASARAFSIAALSFSFPLSTICE